MKQIYLIGLLLVKTIISTAQPTEFTGYTDLKDELKNARLVLLGEKNHYDYASMIEKVRIIEYLHDSLGFDVLAFESSLFDMNVANELIKNGEDVEKALYSGIFSIWHHSAPMDSLIRFLKQTKMKLAGFDNQICSGMNNTCLSFTNELKQFLDLHKIQYSNDIFLALDEEFKSFNNVGYTLSQNFKEETLLELDELIKVISSINSDKSMFWVQNIISIKGFLFDHFHNQINEKNALTFKTIDSNLRDSLMAQNVLYLLKSNPNKKIICWGATYHFSIDISSLTMEGENFSLAKPMGYYLKRELVDEVKIIGVTDLATTQDLTATIENIDLLRNGKAYLKFEGIADGCSSFLTSEGDSNPCGDWSSSLDLGIIINSKGKRRLSGKTILGDSAEPIAFVHVQLENTTKGVISNEQGYFEFILEPDDFGKNIVFSSIGYVSDTLNIEEIKGNILMFQNTMMLDELVVTPSENDPMSIIQDITKELLKRTPKNPFNMFLYSSQTEIADQQTTKKTVLESAIQIYFENRFSNDEIRESTILNKKNNTVDLPSIPWPMATSNADFMAGFRFLNPTTFKNLQIDSLYSYNNSNELAVVEYSHLKPTFKTSGFGLTSNWAGTIIYNINDYSIISHEQVFEFEKNKDYGLFEITFNIEYFKYKDYIFPRLMFSHYKFKKKDGVYMGEEKILVTKIDLENAKRPENKIFEFTAAPSSESFWSSFNIIPISKF